VKINFLISSIANVDGISKILLLQQQMRFLFEEMRVGPKFVAKDKLKYLCGLCSSQQTYSANL